MKKKWYKRKRTWFIIILVLIATPVIAFYVMMNSFDMSDKDVDEFFKANHMQANFKTYRVNGRDVFYAEVGNDTMPTVIFIHGAPGSWYDYIKYFSDSNLNSKAHLIAVDRPGYGKSGAGKSVVSIEEQATMIRPLLDSNKSHQPVILLGHSYGGPIAVKMAMDYPEKVGAIILLAPAIDPANEKMFWVNKPASWGIIKAITPKPMRVANDEKMAHIGELKKMKDDWGKIISPVTYMYGLKDGIVPPVNVEYAREMINQAPLEVTAWPDENHFIPWTQQDSIVKVILKYVNGEGKLKQ